MSTMKFYLVVACSIVFGCESQTLTHGPIPNPARYDFTYWAIKHINVADGIEEYEARFIANAFFVSGVSGCGTPGDPVRNHDKWIFPTFVGYEGIPGDQISVSAVTGDVEWSDQQVTLDQLQKLER